MVAKRRVIAVAPESELARLLDDPAGLPIELVKDGVRYLIARVSDPGNAEKSYDSDRARQALRESAGSWAEDDVDALIDDLYRWREQGSRPFDRPGPIDPA